MKTSDHFDRGDWGSPMQQMVSDNGGQDLIEYGLLAAFLSLAAAGTVTMVGVSLNTWYQEIAGAIRQMGTR